MVAFQCRLALCAALIACFLRDGHAVRTNGEELAKALDMGNRSSDLAPMVWVPGITSSALEARRLPGVPLGAPWCAENIPEEGWYTLYISGKQGKHVGCFLWQLQLQPPDESLAPAEGLPGCVADAPGIEVREVGFGTSAGVAVLNPDDLVPFKLYEEFISALEDLGHARDRTLRFATYDWRKFGDPCWEAAYFPRFQKLIEETSQQAGRAVSLGCHSMGCALVHVFLDQASPEWKERFVQDFIATGPALSGAPAAMQNFVEGPTYAFMPMFVSKIGRATGNSMPGLYTLLPSRLGDSWPEDMAMISTPWKNYSTTSLFDGSFFRDVETPEDESRRGQERREEIEDAEASSLWSDVRADLESYVTEQGCVCASSCRTLHKGPNPGVVSAEWDSIFRPWCYTHGTCGKSALRLRLTLNPFNVVNWKYWDFCGGNSKPIDAGSGFEFFPGVNTKPSGLVRRWFGAAESYSQDSSLQVEEQKARCLSSLECVGFDTEGNLKRGEDHRPETAWRGTQPVKNGVIQGLYMKKPEVRRCQESCASTPLRSLIGFAMGSEVCGSDNQTYSSECSLKSAQCWKPALRLQAVGPCPATYRTPQGCKCASKCSPGLGNTKWCYVEGGCGTKSVTGKKDWHWDYCMDSESLAGGQGFDYFPRAGVKDDNLVLRKVRWYESFYMSRLREQCGRDPLCGGFSTEGVFYTQDFRGSAAKWHGAPKGNAGLYRKTSAVAACQRDCSKEKGEAAAPICHEDSHQTFLSACDAENYRCYLEIPREEFQTKVGPCQHYGDSGLADFGQWWVQRASQLKPPGVPTTCIYVTDVDTDIAWQYEDFLGKGKAIATGPGDGSVAAQSVEGPCRAWQKSQKAKVWLMPLKLGGASHVTMLWNKRFLRTLQRVVTHEDGGCGQVDLAVPRIGKDEASGCKCSEEDATVFCGSEPLSSRKFDLTYVMQHCPSQAMCRSCQDVDGAQRRISIKTDAQCKCSGHRERVYCEGEEVAPRKFALADVLKRCRSEPVCAEDSDSSLSD